MDEELARAHLDSRLNYERKGMPDSSSLRVDRMAQLLARVGDPHRRYHVIHVAGTKGKGSTATMIARLLADLGYRVGLHTSPHVERVEERMQVDGEPPTPELFTRRFEELRGGIEQTDADLSETQPPLTYFEITTAMALYHFAREGVDWAVVEVGMGGRLDSTNVVDPAACVITSISRDHMAQLGYTLPGIAREKAGVIKPGRPVISGVADPSAAEVVAAVSRQNDSPLFQLGRDVHFQCRLMGLDGSRVAVETWRRRWPVLRLGLSGTHQAANCALALAALDAVDGRAAHVVPASLTESLASLSIPGRCEVLAKDPLVVADVAHNDASVTALMEMLKAELHHVRPERRVLIFGTSVDKESAKMLAEAHSFFPTVVATRCTENQRAARPEVLKRLAEDLGMAAQCTEDPAAALGVARRILEATPDPGPGVICITGSFYLVAQTRRMVRDALATPNVQLAQAEPPKSLR